ncbi:hypothetical protein FH972_024499 [Carpinus fangiana]|uniref:CAF17 C-terminal domain-containing protein n=1 Tax=Carpinus fangiana TaxID=176857 RepID=A0A5N6KY70_9ROSI|nr:hypothetical protein FH972_024499 [Carpinus fangiana]
MPPRIPKVAISVASHGCPCRFAGRNLSTAASATLEAAPPAPPPTGLAQLTHRRLLSLYGPDSTHYLQGITTANVRPGLTSGFYSAFLSAQGRVLNDVFIYPSSHSPAFAAALPDSVVAKYGAPSPDTPAYIIEVDAAEADRLLKHLKRYKLRAKLDIRLLNPEAWSLWSVWDEQSPWTPHASPALDAPEPDLLPGRPDTIGTHDARAPGMGRRLVLPATASLDALLQRGVPRAPLAAYTIRRMLRGVPEGQAEVPREAALPLEANLDFMAGVDFRKGCYVGQELTIRTHHTGVVRKRVLPALLYSAAAAAAASSSPASGADAAHVLPPRELHYDPAAPALAAVAPHGADIMPARARRGRSAGKWLAGVGNIGLALCRVEMMTDLVLTAEGSRWSADDAFKLTVPSAAAGAEGDESGGGGASRAARETVQTAGGEEVLVRAFVPDWVRNQVKVKKPNARV